MQCPCCHAINRRQANFCNNCGIGLRDERQTHATPSIGPFGPSPDSSHAIASDSAPATLKPFVPAQPAATEGSDVPDSFDPFPWTAKSGKELVADEAEDRSEERRVGKECRCRWWADQ